MLMFEPGSQDAAATTSDDKGAAEQQDGSVETSLVNNRPLSSLHEEAELVSVHDKIGHQFPRSYYFLTQLVLPLFSLIGLCFLFGYSLARLEKPNEIERNDEMLREILYSYTNHTASREKIWNAMANTSVQCLVESSEEEENGLQPSTFLLDNIENCSLREGKERFPYTPILTVWVEASPSLTFDWIKCYRPSEFNETPSDDFYPYFGLNPKNNHNQQYLRYIVRFAESIEESINQTYPGITHEQIRANYEVLLEFAEQATGSLGCQVHTAGGALFWFTLMTTIGYGNTAPITNGGRMMVYTFGFASIIGFLTLNSAAAQVWKHLVEDIFLWYNLKKLVEGPLSVLFWLGMTLLWMLVIALGHQKYRMSRTDESFPLEDAYWFSFITTTTVGFGDIHIAHEEFTVGAMFIMPLSILMGFNFLAIFMEKGVDLYRFYFPGGCGLKSILHERRLQQRSDEG